MHRIVWCLLLMVGVATGSLGANRIAGRLSVTSALRIANIIGMVGAALFAVADLTGQLSVFTVVASVVVFMIGAGMASPFALAGCGGSDDENAWDGQSINFGALFSTTGDGSPFGPQQVKGAKLAVDEINADGGINGADLQLVQRDDESVRRAREGKHPDRDRLDPLYADRSDAASIACLPDRVDPPIEEQSATSEEQHTIRNGRRKGGPEHSHNQPGKTQRAYPVHGPAQSRRGNGHRRRGLDLVIKSAVESIQRVTPASGTSPRSFNGSPDGHTSHGQRVSHDSTSGSD